MTAFKIYHTGNVSEQGILMGIPKTKLSQELKAFSGKAVELIIQRKSKHRSVQQNRLLWMWNKIIGDEIGCTADEAHEILKAMFLKTELVNEKTGVVYIYIRSTTELSTIEMMDYMMSIQKFANEDLQIVLPEPNDQLTIQE